MEGFIYLRVNTWQYAHKGFIFLATQLNKHQTTDIRHGIWGGNSIDM
jgi:hypothetical protein